MEKDLEELEKRLGITFQKKELLKRALTHSSYRIAHREEVSEDNEKLEFIGDAVLNLCISLLLYEKFPQDREGDLTKKRSYLVCKERLIKVAEKLGILDFLLMGRREKALEMKSKLNMAGRALEAIIGAIYLDQGLEKACEVVRSLFGKYLKTMRASLLSDYKTKLQEFLQKERGVIPIYEIVEIKGPPHKPEIEIAVKLGGEVLATAKGLSRKEAENLAAKKALFKLKKIKTSKGI
jgi:ribonuclease-3